MRVWRSFLRAFRMRRLTDTIGIASPGLARNDLQSTTHMSRLVPVCTVVTLAVIGAIAARTAHQFSIEPRPPDPLLSRLNAADAAAPARQPFALRLVDAGGVGIPLEAWGGDYS